LDQAAGMVGFLFTPDDVFAPDPADADKMLTPASLPVLQAAHDSLAGLPEWELGPIEQVLRSNLIDRLGLKPRLAFGPVRVAATGRRISPPLFESLELLGRESSLRRLQRSIDVLS